jgi:hypothetical protein
MFSFLLKEGEGIKGAEAQRRQGAKITIFIKSYSGVSSRK